MKTKIEFIYDDDLDYVSIIKQEIIKEEPKKTLWEKRETGNMKEDRPFSIDKPVLILDDVKEALKEFVKRLNYDVIGDMSQSDAIDSIAKEIFGKEMIEE